MAGLVYRVSFLMCFVIITQTTQPSDSLSIPSNFVQKFQTIQGFLARVSHDGRMTRQQTPYQTLKLSSHKPIMGNSQFLTISSRSKKTYSSSGNFGIDRFIAFMTYANNLMNSNSGNIRVDNFMTAYNTFFNSNGLNAFNIFYTLQANFWTVVDAVANVVRVTEARIKDRKDEKRAEQEPDPLEELIETFEDTNVNLADISNIFKNLACDPNGGAEIFPSECLTDRDIDEFIEPERSVSNVKLQNKSGQSRSKAPLQTQLHVQPQIVPPILPQPSQPQVRPPTLRLVPPKVVPPIQAQSIPSNILPSVLHTRTHVQSPQNRLQIQPQIPHQNPFQVILQTRALVPPQVRQPIQPQIKPQVRSLPIPQSEAGGSLRRFQVHP